MFQFLIHILHPVCCRLFSLSTWAPFTTEFETKHCPLWLGGLDDEAEPTSNQMDAGKATMLARRNDKGSFAKGTNICYYAWTVISR
jgi:hypothetical protein